MKDNKRKIYHLFILLQICLLLAVCILPVLGQIRQAAVSAVKGNDAANETITDKDQMDNDGSNSESNPVSDENQDDITSNQNDEEDLNLWNLADYTKVVENASPEILSKLETMTLEEKIAQLFIVSPEALTGASRVNAAGSKTKEAIERYPVGGLFYTASNLLYIGQVETMIQDTQKYSESRIGLPMLIGVAEEGGNRSPFAGNNNFDLSIDSLAEIGATNNPDNAAAAGKEAGKYLANLGFNYTLSPVADVTYMDNSASEGETFGKDSSMVSDMVAAYVKALKNEGISSALKYFPGKGYSPKTAENEYPVSTMEISGYEDQFKVYEDAIAAGADFVMVGHILPKGANQTGELASMSSTVIEKKLRNIIGFDGLVITEALNKKNITENYSSAQAAVNVFMAGADIIFMPENFEEAYNGLIQAVKDGEIEEVRVDASVVRILREKME